MKKWRRTTGTNVWHFRDSCVVYAFETGDGVVVVNAGTGAWIEHLDELPARPIAVLLTHFFRDHSAGAVAAAHAGIAVWAPFEERELLADPVGHFARRETYIMYDNAWDLFAPIEPIPVDRWLHDLQTVDLGGTSVTVIPTPGQSNGAVSYLVDAPFGRAVFAGETIHSPGRVLRLAPLQYNYNDLTGAVNLLYSLDQLRRADPDWIASSTNEEVIDAPLLAIDLLEHNLRAALAARGIDDDQLACATGDGLTEITPHLFQSDFGGASTYFVVSESGAVLSIDYGYRIGVGWGGNYPFPRNRRAILHGLDALQRRLDIRGIEAVIVTHFHDDHVAGIPVLQRLYGTTCYASETFARILANPSEYAYPCTWPHPIAVVELKNEVPHRWREYEFSLYPMSGHTRFSSLIRIDIDGERVVATGDQYFFRDISRPGTGPLSHNHVYRNGAVIGSFRDSHELLASLNPTIILPGHGDAYRVPSGLLKSTAEYRDEYERLHRVLMPIGDDDIHFDVDSRAGRLVPYRTAVPEARPIVYRAHVRNPYPDSAELTLRIAGPKGWQSEPACVRADGRAEVEVRLVLVPPSGAVCRRQPVALELSCGDRAFGQVAEALVTIGSELF